MSETKIEIVGLDLGDPQEVQKPKRSRKPKTVTEEYRKKLQANANKARSKVVDMMKKGREIIENEEDAEAIDLENPTEKVTVDEIKKQENTDKQTHQDLINQIQALLTSELDKREKAKLERLEAKRTAKEEKKKAIQPREKPLSAAEIKQILAHRDYELTKQMTDKYRAAVNQLKSNLNF